jgi:hypothetical protein
MTPGAFDRYVDGLFLLLRLVRVVWGLPGLWGVYKPLGLTVLLVARLGDVSPALSLGGLKVDGSPVPLGSTATHDPTGIPKSLWARRKPLDKTRETPK